MTGRYQDADAFRDALEQRIRKANQETGTPHDRVRKDVAFNRLVARFIAAADVRWALKGGVALLWRLAADARATRDVDANWRGTQDELVAFLDRVVASGGHDWFEFEISLPRSIEGETEGGVRFGVTARLAGREFAAFHLDVNFVTDARPVELVRIEVPLLSFVGLDGIPQISTPGLRPFGSRGREATRDRLAQTVAAHPRWHRHSLGLVGPKDSVLD